MSPIIQVSNSVTDSFDCHAIPTTPESYWDQFSENQRLFGTTSTFDPSLSAYTTPLVLDSLTPEQIAKAEELSKIMLPSEKLAAGEHACTYCGSTFNSTDQLVDHIKSILLEEEIAAAITKCEVSGIKSILKRKSWIVVQESLPHGLVSQIEGLYKRPITSSTNLQSIVDCIRQSQSSDEVREYLLKELVCLILSLSTFTQSDKRIKKSSTPIATVTGTSTEAGKSQ